MRKIFIFLIILSFLSGCQSAKDALTMKKKKSGDEFLVEKKKPPCFTSKLWRVANTN